MGLDRGLPTLHFDQRDLPGPDQFDIFHDTTAPLFDTGPLSPVDRFRASATDYLVGDAVVSSTSFSAQSLRRTRQQTASGDTDWICVVSPRRGEVHGEVAAATCVHTTAGRPLILDMAQPFELRSNGADLLWASVPRSHVPAAARRLERESPALCDELPTATRRAIVHTLERVWDRLPDASPDDAGELEGRLIELVDSALSPGAMIPSPSDVPAAMRRFVMAHLDDLDLGVATLEEAFHCSRASVYRQFADEGGVAAFIRRERLQRCYAELASSTVFPRRISEVGVRWGFDNPSHFHRLFTAAFGAAPSVVARRVRPNVDSLRSELSSGINRFHDWARTS